MNNSMSGSNISFGTVLLARESNESPSGKKEDMTNNMNIMY
jgi:hypothetical protein